MAHFHVGVTITHDPIEEPVLTPDVLTVRNLKNELIRSIIPMDMMPLLEANDLVTIIERQRIECTTNKEGPIKAAMELLDMIIRRDFWNKFIGILKHEDVKLENIAKLLEEEKENIEKDREARKQKEKEKIEKDREHEEARKQKEKQVDKAVEEANSIDIQEETLLSDAKWRETSQLSTSYTSAILELEPIVPRKYQMELAQPGINGHNVIVCAPTGSGKTMIASLIAKAHLNKMASQDRKANILYLVPRFTILQHIYSEFTKYMPLAKLGYRYGGFQSDQPFNIMFNDNEVVVATADIFRNALAANEMTICAVSLLLFDECHYTMDKHPYNKIMYEYLKLKSTGSRNLPQLAGFTASPGAGGNLVIAKAFDHIIKLSSNLDCQVFATVPSGLSDELEEHIHHPTKYSYVVLPDYNNPIARLLIQAMENIENLVFGTAVTGILQGTQQYESKMAQYKRDNPEDTTSHVYVEHLTTYNTALRLLFVSTGEACLAFMKSKYDEFKSRTNLLPEEETLWKIFKERVVQQLAVSTESTNNESLRYLMEALTQHECEMKSNGKDIRGIIFIRTIAEATALKTWMESVEVMQTYNAAVITGSDSMSKPQQIEITNKFNDGFHKVLLSTTLLSEGVDIKECNLVVNYHFVTNEIFMIQSRGRARAGNSKLIVIGMQQTSEKDVLNTRIEGVMKEAIEKIQRLSNEEFRSKIKDMQNQIIQEWERANKEKEQLQSKNNATDVELLCDRCPPGKNSVCFVSDIVCYKESFYVNPTDSFMQKIKITEEDTPSKKKQLGDKRFVCAECGSKWGKMISGFPCLAIDKFNIKIKGNAVPKIKKWSKVPCKVPEFLAE